MKITHSLKTIILVLLVTLISVTGCNRDETGPLGGNENDNLTLSAMSDPEITDGNGIVITEAKALIGEVELETEPSTGNNSVHLQLSPFVVNLNSISVAQLAASVTIPEGNYRKIKFQIHKPEDNETPPDPEFKTGNSGNQRFSIIVKGTYNGNQFIYRSRRSANVVLFLNSIVNISNTSRNITMIVNPSNWFKSGNNFIDPSNDDNEDIIDDNIKNSFRRAFRDDNRDGIPD